MTDLCAEADEYLVLVAPFIKEPSLRDLLGNVREEVSVTVVTRWEIGEIIQGVSDIQVWEALRDRPRSRLLLYPRLHAKVYTNEKRALVGSANLTRAALAGPQWGNLELLTPVALEKPDVREVLATALAGEVVNETLYQSYCAALAALPPPSLAPAPSPKWIPRFRRPDHLFRIYSATPEEREVKWPQELVQIALSDIASLGVPAGLGRESFNAIVSISLRHQAVIVDLRAFVLAHGSVRFGQVRDWLSARVEREHADALTQTLYRWIKFYLADSFQYERPGHSELLSCM